MFLFTMLACEAVDQPVTDIQAATAGPDFALWRYPLQVDGLDDDWTEAVTFEAGHDGRMAVTWDDYNLYLGLTHPDLLEGGDQHFWLVYLGNGAHATVHGVPFNSQQPGLPFAATQLVVVRADGHYAALHQWDGERWQHHPDVFNTPGALIERRHQTVEVALSLYELQIGQRLDVVAAMVYEGDGWESTYAPMPVDSFDEGAYDPDYQRFWAFDLWSVDPPVFHRTRPL